MQVLGCENVREMLASIPQLEFLDAAICTLYKNEIPLNALNAGFK